ncbi:transmembrane and ubiquitin-like domain-containing protein 1 [Rhinatrema bivittatum]|uniref:transmembrane and ubiquitin-like domain-containing protein 1 n=1 Tax=Rhinatrema bivittatum TaxID=194408 RepID=UPI00112BA6E7|nr:transmembrane and ubiquitin-like domain-containing protein 1 [Rhinatrema bivittatum]
MALIEGVGDEVTLLFALVFCLLVLGLAWVSTHTSEWGSTPFASAAPAFPPSQRAGEERGENALPSSADASSSSPSPAESTAPAGLRHRINAAGPEGGPAEGPSPLACPPGSLRAGPVSAPAGSAELMVLRLKFLNDSERLIRVRPEDTLSYIKRTFFPGQEHLVRLIYQGQLLRDDAQTMASLHLANNCVLHCHISPHAAPQGPSGARAGGEQAAPSLNMGNLMVPLFLLMLALLWYCQVQYQHYFTASATVCLASVTVFFSFMAFSMYRR